jgi:hypothetical protein
MFPQRNRACRTRIVTSSTETRVLPAPTTPPRDCEIDNATNASAGPPITARRRWSTRRTAHRNCESRCHHVHTRDHKSISPCRRPLASNFRRQEYSRISCWIFINSRCLVCPGNPTVTRSKRQIESLVLNVAKWRVAERHAEVSRSTSQAQKRCYAGTNGSGHENASHGVRAANVGGGSDRGEAIIRDRSSAARSNRKLNLEALLAGNKIASASCKVESTILDDGRSQGSRMVYHSSITLLLFGGSSTLRHPEFENATGKIRELPTQDIGRTKSDPEYTTVSGSWIRCPGESKSAPTS